MNVKKVKRLCTVKGCKNTDSFAISRSSEYGGVIICRECLTEAMKAAKIAEETGAAKVSTDKREQRPAAELFHHPEKAGKIETAKAPEEGELGADDHGSEAETATPKRQTKGKRE